MCRNIRTLFNFEPPATEAEVRASAVQFVRKLSGYTKPSKANEAAFEQAVEDVSNAAHRLLDSLQTASPPRDREEVAMKARAQTSARGLLRGPHDRPQGEYQFVASGPISGAQFCNRKLPQLDPPPPCWGASVSASHSL